MNDTDGNRENDRTEDGRSTPEPLTDAEMTAEDDDKGRGPDPWEQPDADGPDGDGDGWGDPGADGADGGGYIEIESGDPDRDTGE